MAYDAQVVAAAKERLAERRSRAARKAAALRAELIAREPRVRQLEQEIAAALPKLTKTILEHGDPQAITAVQQENLRLQNELSALLHQLGYPVDNFEPQCVCTQCKDTGYVDGRICTCYSRLLKEEACKRLSSLSAMKLTDFDSLNSGLYDDTVDEKLGTSPRRRMLDIIAYCRAYAENFQSGAESLLLQGATGTGKTHLSLAIAKSVTEAGYGVVYGSVQPLLRRMESEHFGRAEGNTEEQLTSCDLLVLDDLGMELDSPFYRSCIYSLLNERLLDGKSTIISTNLSFSALKERYGDQIASRIVGGFQPLLCVGRDIRQVLRRRSME